MPNAKHQENPRFPGPLGGYLRCRLQASWEMLTNTLRTISSQIESMLCFL